MIILMMHASIWRERTIAQTAASIRKDRDWQWWELVREMPEVMRKADGVLHRHPGQQRQLDAVFIAVWGTDWQSHFASYTSQSEWRAHRGNWVEPTCTVLGLPSPSYYSLPAAQQHRH